MAEKKEFLTYKGKPLVRQGNTIYYGDMADDYVIMMQILAKKEVGDKDKAEVASKVSVQLLSTDPNASMKERIIKTSEKKGLYAAMDIAEIWLQRALAHEYEKAPYRDIGTALYFFPFKVLSRLSHEFCEYFDYNARER